MDRVRSVNIALLAAIMLFSFCTKPSRQTETKAAQTSASDTMEIEEEEESETIEAEEEEISEQKEKMAFTPLSHAEILKKMEHAVKVLNKAKETHVFYEFFGLMEKDVEELVSYKRESEYENVNHIDEFIDHFGEPHETKIHRYSTDWGDGNISFRERAEYIYPFCTLYAWDDYYTVDEHCKYGSLVGIKSSEPGFGFGGIYPGVPECNKEYIKKLFAKIISEYREEEQQDEYGDTFRFIILDYEIEASYQSLTLKLNDNDVVTEVDYLLDPDA